MEMRHFLPGLLPHIGQQPIARRLQSKIARHLATARKNPAISSSLAAAVKSANDTQRPLGITSTCIGACGLMSWNASDHSSSKTFLQGISPRKILAKMFCSSYSPNPFTGIVASPSWSFSGFQND